MSCYNFQRTTTRRQMLRRSAAGFGGVALAAMAARQAAAGVAQPDALPVGSGLHFPARAKRIIFLFMWGGPSHVDLFDPKPRLNQQAGKPLSGSSVGVEQTIARNGARITVSVSAIRSRWGVDE